MINNTRGNASVTVLVVMFALAVMFTAAAFFMRELVGFYGEVETAADLHTELRAEAVRLIELMTEDPTPEADSYLDPVWSEISFASSAALKIKLEDVSSRINPNQAYDYILNAAHIFESTTTYEAFHDYRVEHGPVLDLAKEYGEFFKKDELSKYCTSYGWFNVNTSNESMLYLLFELRTGKKAEGTLFASRLRQKRTAKELFTAASVKELLGVDLEAVYPFISSEPEINVNLAPRAVLFTVLTVGKNVYKVPLKDGLVDDILAVRMGSEITAEGLTNLIRPKFRTTIMESYLGVTTWFWRLTLEKNGRRYRCVFARLPALPGEKDDTPRFRIVEETFGPAAPETEADNATEEIPGGE
ncbi:MAG TPA: hypothetical protein ENN69_06215 [Spirochaetia bacterium]|nr:hypothetical protein [Spirochaetia bacterium]